MKNPVQIVKRSLLLTTVVMFAAGCSDSGIGTQSTGTTDKQNATGMSDNTGESRNQDRPVEIKVADGSFSSDSSMAAENWDSLAGPNPETVEPSGDVGMVAAEWRSLDQPVVKQSEFAAKNWENPDKSEPIADQSSEYDMAAENWGVKRTGK
ncbi:MAG TPA: hypothetical protein VLN56_06105 [Gammaproteobacteria bacterium]|nr:hypothetical protein [Gammaproteobacteria bacterium]